MLRRFAFKSYKQLLVYPQKLRFYDTNADTRLSSEEIVELNKQAVKGVGQPILSKEQMKEEMKDAIHDVDMHHNYNRYHAEEAIDKTTDLGSAENKELKKEIKKEAMS